MTFSRVSFYESTASGHTVKFHCTPAPLHLSVIISLSSAHHQFMASVFMTCLLNLSSYPGIAML